MRRIWLALLLAAVAATEERFPPPDFSPGYVIPVPTVPPPDPAWWAALDVGLLALALALTGWAALARRSRTLVAVIALACLVWFGFVRQGCVCPIGAIQDVARACADGGGLSWIAAAFFVLPLATALLAGRLFCSGVCPLGAIQDLVLVRPLRLPAAITGALGLLPYAYLALAVTWAATGAAYAICAYDPFVGFFRLDGPAWMLVAGGGLLLSATVIGRPYCRFLCPYGVLLRWLAPLARTGIRIHPTRCTNCRLCEESCPYGAIRVPVPEDAPRPSRRLLALLLAAAPLLIAGGAWLGHRAGDTLATRHATVTLSTRLAAEDAGTAQGANDAAEAFRRLALPADVLHAEAAAIRARTRLLAALGGGFLGLVAAWSLIARSRRPRRTTYEADPAACVSCARCLPDCPADRPAPAAPPPSPRRHAWTSVGLIAAFFAVFVAAALLANHGQMRSVDPLAAEGLTALKAELTQRPKDEALKERIRAYDAELRSAWFTRQDLARHGAWLLLAGAALAIGALKLARRFDDRPFDPRGLPPPDALAEARGSRLGVAVIVAGLAVGLVALGSPAAPTAAPAVARPTLPPPPAPEEIARQWPGFRGPAAGQAQGPAPTAWDAASGVNLRWKAEIPLPGVSSPAVWGSTVYLTGADANTQEVFAYDADSGALRWRCAIPIPLGTRVEPFTDTGYAAPSPATDGRVVVALFATGILAAVSPDGALLWTRRLGVPESSYSLAASPLIWRDRVIVQLDQGARDDGPSALIACDLGSGRELWRTRRPVPESWSSPLLATLGGRDQIITCGDPLAISYDPESGAELWRADCLGGEIAASPALAGGNIVVANDSGAIACLRPDGSEVWRADEHLPDMASPVADAALVLTIAPDGTLACRDAATGALLWQHPTDMVHRASPVLAGGRVYATDEHGTTRIFAWTRELTVLGSASIGEDVSATPAIVGGRIYARGAKHLFCIAEGP